MKVARGKLTQPASYPLHGFSYAFQIWIMEAIPDFGVMLGKKLNEEGIVFPRCSNWSGSCVISYPEIRQLEATFGSEHVLHPFISSTGNADIIDVYELRRPSEMRDERVDETIRLINGGKDWATHIWEVKVTEENSLPSDAETEPEGGESVPGGRTPTAAVSSASTSRKGKSKIRDYGVVERKQKLLCERSMGKQAALNEEMKGFIEGLFEASFTSLENKIGKKIENEVANRFSVVHTEIRDLRDLVTSSKMSTSRGEPSKITKAPSVSKSPSASKGPIPSKPPSASVKLQSQSQKKEVKKKK